MVTQSRYLDHTTGPADRWDTIAYAYYGDANRTGPLIRANRALFEGDLTAIPCVLPPRITLRVPVLEPDPVAAELLPPWKRGVAA